MLDPLAVNETPPPNKWTRDKNYLDSQSLNLMGVSNAFAIDFAPPSADSIRCNSLLGNDCLFGRK